MNSTSLFAKCLRRFAAGLLLLPLLLGSLLAQASTGTITGRIFDDASGRSLQGAVVTVRGTPARDYTDAEGRFSLPAVRSGPATLDIEYIGLDPASQDVSVLAGSTANVTISLKSSVLQLAAFEVKEAARGQALASNQQKTAAGIVNIVSEETFGNMNDGNVGYALQRLPGLSVDEAQDGSPIGINLRGVSGEFNSFQIDGNRAPNSGGTSRAADTRQLVADGITNIEVIKAPTPDRDGDAIGGIVNIISRTAFQRDGREVRVTASGSYNDLSGDWGHNGRLTYSDIFSVGGKEKNLGISFTLTQYTTDRYSENADVDWVAVTAADNPQLNLTNDTKFLEASHSERSFRTTHTTGINGAIDFRTDEHNSFYFRPMYSQYDQESQTYETDWDIDTRFQDQANGRKTYAFLSSDGSRGGGTPGPNGSRSTLGYIGTDNDSHNDLYAYSFGGRHERDTMSLNYDFFYSTSKSVRDNDAEFNFRLDPIAQGYYVMEYEASNRLRPSITITNGLSPTDFAFARQGPANLIMEPQTKDEEVYSAKADWEKKFLGDRTSSALKVGAKYRVSKPSLERETYDYSVLGADRAAFPFESVISPASGTVLSFPRYMLAEPDKAREVLRTRPDLWTLNEADSFEGSNLADYSAEEATTAGYVMGTTQFGRHTIIAGVRLEQNEWTRNNKTVVANEDGTFSTLPATSSNKYDIWLPGLHFRHELTKNLILRESYNKSYGRPSLNDISRGRNVDTEGNISDGNPALEPSESDNVDVQLEYYTANGGLYSAGVFYKKIKNFTYTNVISFDELDAQGRPIAAEDGEFEYEQPLNGPGAKNYGLELIARQRLTFLPGPLKGLTASVSATFTESDAEIPGREGDKLPLEGFSDYLFTSSLEYAWGNFRARVDYRYRADYIEGLGDSLPEDEWFSAREQLDAEVGYRFTRNFNLFVTGTNLTHTPQVSYTGSRGFPEDISYSGRKYTFGVEYKF